MNPYQMPIEQRKAQEFRSFAKMVVYAVLFGLFIAVLVFPWGQQ